MALPTRKIIGKTYSQDGAILTSARIEAVLEKVTAVDSGLVFPFPQKGTAFSDANGDFEITVYAGATYRIRTYGQDTFSHAETVVAVPEGTGDINIGVLTASTEIEGNESAIATIEASFNQKIEAAIAAVELSGGSDDLRTGTSPTALSGHRVVASVGGVIEYASNSNAATAFNIVGISTNAGTDITYRTKGILNEPSWSWNDGPIFLGADGLLTQSPDLSAAFSLQVGTALTSQQIQVSIQTPIFRS